MAKKRYTQKELIDAITAAEGYVSKAASLLGCTAQTLYNYRDRSGYQKFSETWADIREKRHDFVENALHKQIKDGNVTAIIFYLKTQAKDRGYVERQEVTGKDGEPLRVKFIDYGLNDNNTD